MNAACDHDVRIGRTEVLGLEGKKFILKLQGRRWIGNRLVGSETHTKDLTFFWYEGEGKIATPEEATGLETPVCVFTFRTWEAKGFAGQTRLLHDFICASTQLEKHLEVVKPLELTDFICLRVLRKTKPAEKTIFPHINFNPLPFRELLEKGIVPDVNGQIHLPIHQ